MMAKTKTAKPETKQEAAEAQPAVSPAGQPEQSAASDAGQAHEAEFARLDAGAQPDSRTSLEMILDLELHVTAELGRAELMIRDLLQLGPGSIIELDKTVGEPVDLMVNGRLIARGEVVVLDESFGVRISDIVTPVERTASIPVPEQEVEQT